MTDGLTQASAMRWRWRPAVPARDLGRHVLAYANSLTPHGVAGRLTVLLIALYGLRTWQFSVPVTVIAAFGLAAPLLLGTSGYWVLLALVEAVVVLPRTYTIDNHKLLLLYWTTALALTVDCPEALRYNARRLIGLCFLLATSWKVGWGEYFDGTFLRYALATDGRFAFLAHWLGGAPLGAASANSGVVEEVLRGNVREAVLIDGPRSRIVALVLSWWTLLVEGGIAAAFLLPERWRLARSRNALLLIFVLSTYAVAPVIGFAWLLVLMGFAQCDTTEPRSKIGYLAALGLTQVFLVPWGPILTGSGD